MGGKNVKADSQFWYETEAAFKNQYQEKIDAITSRATTDGPSKAGTAAWSGQSVREGTEATNRWARESEQQAGTEVQPSGELLAQLSAQTTDRREASYLNELRFIFCESEKESQAARLSLHFALLQSRSQALKKQLFYASKTSKITSLVHLGIMCPLI